MVSLTFDMDLGLAVRLTTWLWNDMDLDGDVWCRTAKGNTFQLVGIDGEDLVVRAHESYEDEVKIDASAVSTISVTMPVELVEELGRALNAGVRP